MDRWCSWPVSPVRETHERTRQINTYINNIIGGTVYILLLSNKRTYTGSTSNLVRRIAEHNKGTVYSTKRFLPVIIIYTENFESIEEARSKEKFYKTSWGRRKLKKIIDPIIKKNYGPVV